MSGNTAIRVNLEFGHEASLRAKKTPDGYTHDWEVFVRGQEGADISHYVEKVVFILHDTFPKPRRVVKEPPFTIKESGYAGFPLPIEIYLKNKDEPKKIKFSYDLTLEPFAFLKDRSIFKNPNEDFKKKLLKGGGFPIAYTPSYYTNPDQETRSKDSFPEEKQQLLSKPKLSSENVKKHKPKEHKEEIPHRPSSFENLFGPPIHKPPKVSPDPKKLDKNLTTSKPDKKEKDRSSSEKKSKHEHKETKPDKVKSKGDKDKAKQDKIKNYNKEQEKSKDKASKRSIERPPSPEVIKKKCVSPLRRPPSPPPRSSSAASGKDEYRVPKHSEPEPRKPKPEEKPPEPKPDKEQKEKKKKEKKSHEREKERKEKKEHKKENHKRRESPNKEIAKETPKEMFKTRDIPKEKEPTPIKDKPFKPEKVNKFSIENLQKTSPAEVEDKSSHHKNKDKSDSERKHKHKKKDKKRDESKEKHKESSKDKKHKHEKVRTPVEKPEIIQHRETPIPKEPPHQELASPISVDTASQCSSKSGLAKTSHVIDDINSSHSDSESSIIVEDDEKPKTNPSPEPVRELSPEPEPQPEPEAEPEPEIQPVEVPPPQPKEKSKKHKDKSSKREEKRRKRKAEEEDGENRKVAKTAEPGPAFIETERGESSGSVTTETKVQDNGVSSSLGEDAEPGDISPDYMVQLRDLQQRIMKIKDNEDLERVVNLIAETGRYEVNTQTFDFDLCLLDRSTVQQLIRLVGC